GNYMIMSKEETSLPKGVLFDPNDVWTLEFDGSYSSVGSGVVVVLISPGAK
ncbi:hypothetical protein KI387_011416, partial [Taxus chinensis]